MKSSKNKSIGILTTLISLFLLTHSICLFGQSEDIEIAGPLMTASDIWDMDLLDQIKIPDSLNRVDRKGHKYGWQIEYLDRAWKQVPKEKSYYYRYTYYTNGHSLFDPLPQNCKNTTIKAEKKSGALRMGEPVMLNGKYFCYYKDSLIVGAAQYKDGIRSGIHKVYDMAGNVIIVADYDKKYNPYQDFSFYQVTYNRDGSIATRGYYGFGKSSNSKGHKSCRFGFFP
jgi:hypothetical protein